MFRTLLVDDEPLALRRLERLLQEHAAVIRVVGHARDGEEALARIAELKPDLVFLDVQMPEPNGFQVLERITERPFIIFCTAFDEYALRAFETDSVDYLLKPVEPERLERAVRKLERFAGAGAAETLGQGLEKLLARLKAGPTQWLRVEDGDRVRLLDPAEVCFLRAAEKYVEIHTRTETYLTDRSLSRILEDLPPGEFVRIHRSAVVNLRHVDEIRKRFGSLPVVRMKDRARTELPVSRGGKSALGL